MARYKGFLSLLNLTLICLFLLSFSATAFGEETITETPLQISLIPGFGTHPSGNVIADFSVNILGGRTVETRKFEIGGLFNWNTTAMTGVQFGGLANFIEGDASGVQFAGLANVTLGESASVGFSGLGNYSGGEMAGLGFSGGVNAALGDMAGIYFAGLTNANMGENAGIFFSGLVNFSAEEAAGIYFAGLANAYGGEAAGMFFSGLANVTLGEAAGIHAATLLNYSEDYAGIELGMINVAKKTFGMQIGLLNYAESLEGVPIGLISFVRNYPLRLDAWWSETAALSVALRSGNGKYYNLLALGANPYESDFFWSVGWGLGKETWLSSANYLNTDFIISQLFYKGYQDDKNYFLLKLRELFGLTVMDHLDLYAGPTLNLLFSESANADRVALWGPQNPTWESGDTGIYFWPGIVVGVRY